MKKRFILSVVLVLSVFLHSCALPGNRVPGSAWPSDYAFGMIFSSEDNGSVVKLFDHNHSEVFHYDLPYLNISFCGFSNAVIYDNVLYLCPQGESQKLDFGKVVALSLADGSTVEYDFQRTNIITCGADERFIYSVSNLNMVSYLDRWDKKTDEIKTVAMNGVIASSIIPCNGRLFGISVQDDIYSLCMYDFDASAQIDMYTFEQNRMVEFLTSKDNHIWLTDGPFLYCYDTESDTMEKTKLSGDDGYNVVASDNQLFIAFTDIHEDKPSTVECIDLETYEILWRSSVPQPILQMEVSNENEAVYLLGYDSVYRLDYNGELTAEVNYSIENYYCGGMFVK